VRIGQDTVRIALQSVWLGIIISVGLMLVAAFGLLPALAGAWLQEVVDLVAILGALRAVGPRRERAGSVAKPHVKWATISAPASHAPSTANESPER
jgi:hypothetical protein